GAVGPEKVLDWGGRLAHGLGGGRRQQQRPGEQAPKGEHVRLRGKTGGGQPPGRRGALPIILPSAGSVCRSALFGGPARTLLERTQPLALARQLVVADLADQAPSPGPDVLATAVLVPRVPAPDPVRVVDHCRIRAHRLDGAGVRDRVEPTAGRGAVATI